MQELQAKQAMVTPWSHPTACRKGGQMTEEQQQQQVAGTSVQLRWKECSARSTGECLCVCSKSNNNKQKTGGKLCSIKSSSHPPVRDVGFRHNNRNKLHGCLKKTICSCKVCKEVDIGPGSSCKLCMHPAFAIVFLSCQ